jgi:hypothetical protein
LIEDTVDDMLMIEAPVPRSTILGRNARIVRYIERTLRTKDASHSTGAASRIVP